MITSRHTDMYISYVN
ncbi:hypothetical protein NQ318_015541 [Aromia moschata]|uniref:Uncharacterized protein n=1 Tax=Aromia moschata TaxID=1265417 RepID=A0AAV8Y8B2_9CUCU|nr:hypothetical protein NQ318_015541 [Aromia moschata]